MDLFEEKNVKPMLIKDMLEPFNSRNYIYELKLDGIRCVAYMDETTTDLRNKRNELILSHFPELSGINAFVKSKCILDGELVVIKKGIPDFFEVQRRSLMSDSYKIKLASSQYPASFVAYDILYINNRQITDLPLLERKKLLEETIHEHVNLAVSRYVPEHGIELFNLAKQQNLEGVIAKAKDSRYTLDISTTDWIKFNILATKDYVICGYMMKENGLVSLILGQYRGNKLIYKGHVTMGVRPSFISENHYNKIIHSPFQLTPSGNESAVWLEPTLVCVVQYIPNDKGRLRNPVFKGFRVEKNPLDCQDNE